MDFGREEHPLTLAPRAYAALVGFLLCFGAVPFFFWLGDQRLIPWADEARWHELRRKSEALTPNIADTDRIELRRTTCFGACPQYSLVLFASGRVEFTGENFVCNVGHHSAQVNAGVAAKLIADFAASGYFKLSWTAGMQVSDAPTVYTRLAVGTQSRSIEHYHGDDGTPRVLDEMERSVDEVAGTARWLPRRIGHDLVCEFADGSRKRVYDLEYPKS